MSYNVGGVRESRRGWRNWKHMGALPIPFFLPFFTPPSFLSFPIFYPLGVCRNPVFHVTSKGFGFLFTKENSFYRSFASFSPYFILFHCRVSRVYSDKSISHTVVRKLKDVKDYLKLFSIIFRYHSFSIGSSGSKTEYFWKMEKDTFAIVWHG